MNVKTGIVTTAAAGAGYLAIEYLRRRSWIDLRDKVVLITGGSRGLGLAMAREFGARGARVAICARDQRQLERAQADLAGRGIRSHAFVCDVTYRERVVEMVEEINQLLGPIDILVNNAGTIRVGPFPESTLEDFAEAMKVMFWGPLYVTWAVVPSMRQRNQGRIVNITSIGGKVSVPHLLPYSCAKFAAVALSEGLRAELGPAGIRVTTIAPGLLRTGSHLNAEFTGKQSAEYAWFAAAAASPLVSIGAARAARAVVRATVRGTDEKVLSVPAELLAKLHGAAPGLTSRLMGLAVRLLPGENGGLSEVRRGYELEEGLNSSLWKTFTGPGRRAAEALNQLDTGSRVEAPA